MKSPGDPDEVKTFDPSLKTNHYEAQGSYTVELVGEQRRLMRLRRSDDHIHEDDHCDSQISSVWM